MLAAHYQLSKTDVSCSWIPKSKEDNSLKTIREAYNIPEHPRLSNSDLSESDVDELVQRLRQLPPAGFAWLLKKESDEDAIFERVVDVQSLLLSNDYSVAENQSLYLRQALELLPSKVIEIAESTAGENKKIDWFNVRRFRISSSSFGLLIGHITKNRFPRSLFTKLYGKFMLSNCVESEIKL